MGITIEPLQGSANGPRLALSLQPEPVSHRRKPEVFHDLGGTGATQAKTWNRSWFSSVQPQRFVYEERHSFSHLLQTEMEAHTSTASLSSLLTALRILEEFRQYCRIMLCLRCLIATR